MLADLGFYLLLLCCITSIYGSGAAVLSAVWRHRRLYRSSRLAVTSSLVMASAAAGILLYSLFQRDYSIAYIFKNSSNDLPRVYTLSAFLVVARRLAFSLDAPANHVLDHCPMDV